MKKIALSSLSENVFDLIGKEWMLVTAGTPERCNMLTASWGCLGYLWNKPVAVVFIRENRYTREFIEANDYLSLSFFGTNRDSRQLLNFCGSRSGRDVNKVKETGLTPELTDNGAVGFLQARLILEGKKLYRSHIEEADFLDKSVYTRWYNASPGGEHHYVYIVELTNAYEGDQSPLQNDEAGALH